MEYKIVFTGVAGAGKTTAIAAVSEMAPVNTDVRSQDDALDKEFTTVGLDYGEITLENGHRLRLYGTPGQERFEFMWRVLARGALGVIILADHSQDDPMGTLDQYAASFAELIKRTACVVGVGRSGNDTDTVLDSYAERMAGHGIVCPVVPVDVRERDDVLLLLDLLITQLETKDREPDENF